MLTCTVKLTSSVPWHNCCSTNAYLPCMDRLFSLQSFCREQGHFLPWPKNQVLWWFYSGSYDFVHPPRCGFLPFASTNREQCSKVPYHHFSGKYLHHCTCGSFPSCQGCKYQFLHYPFLQTQLNSKTTKQALVARQVLRVTISHLKISSNLTNNLSLCLM